MKPLIALLCVWAQALCAALTVDGIYQPHMVLQQGQQVPVSGTCSGAEPVEVRFNGQRVTATREGERWQAILAPMAAQAKGQTLRITQGDESVEVEDVLVGEVWLTSDEVKKPKYARYAWTVFIEPNLVNEAGLPLAPYAGNAPL